MLAVGTNRKLGKQVASISRPVGPTCPSDCPFLSGVAPDGSEVPLRERCYAQSIERRYKSVAANWAKGAPRSLAQRVQWRSELQAEIAKAANRRTNPIVALRIHVGGDFLVGDRLDRNYLADLLRVLRAVRNGDGRESGIGVWFYTHAWWELAPYLGRLRRLGVQTFASVHPGDDVQAALDLGYRLAIDPGCALPDSVPSTVTFHDLPVLVCPEQRKGADKVTCSTCGYCFREYDKPRHVAFYRH